MKSFAFKNEVNDPKHHNKLIILNVSVWVVLLYVSF